MSDPAPVRSTGIGSWPGTDLTEAVKIAFAECPDLPYLPELPQRGPAAGMIGRATALLHELPVDLQPAGWRLSDSSGREHRQARAVLRSDLDQLEEQAQGYAGPVKLSVGGPWTLAASMERPRGDRVLADRGARRELGQSLAEGIAQLVLDLRRRLPEVEWLVQLDEPLLPAVLAGGVRTASGLHRHRAVDRPEVSGTYGQLVERLEAAGAATPVLVHCCAADVPVELLRRAGVTGLMLDVDRADSRTWDQVAEALEAGTLIGLGALRTDRGREPGRPNARGVADRALRPLRALGLGPDVSGRLLVTPACGLAGFDRAGAIDALRAVREAAEIVSEELAR
ncbi:uroporphyrinogen decarboxylase/cobalamine-independent methonine synthase family protein [Microlunatus ginsengisoli]|uniref:Methionine synthase n=1 Tax=Microlunatus ginsengisoli TaxID=363863 RepID=A0ABP6ZJT5_9ACTN